MADDWEASLAGLLEAPGPAGGEPVLGLHVEVLEGARIAMRPVTRGPKGTWTKTGVAWDTLNHSKFRVDALRSHPQYQQAARLLGEILAMCRPGNAYYQSNTPVHLEELATRRVWPLLAEARDSGVPLLAQLRPPKPLQLRDDPVQLGLDVRRRGEHLEVAARLTAGDSELAADGIVLVGSPAHGAAWWTAGGRGAGRTLSLAPLAREVDPVVQQLVSRGLSVPAEDEERFAADYLPRLQRRVPVVSGDRSVRLPVVDPPTLLVRVSHEVAGGIRVRSHWVYAGVGDVPLAPGGSWERDAKAEAATLLEANRVAGVILALKRVLPADMSLHGFDAVRFVREIVPALRGIPHVQVDVDAKLPDFREALAAPIITATATPRDGDWYDLAVHVEVDGHKVPFELIFMLVARGQSHLLLPSGTYFSLQRPEIAALATLIAEARELQDPGPSPLTVSRYQTDLWFQLNLLGVIDLETAEWRGRLLGWDDGVPAPDVPETVAATLRPYQVEGFHWLVERFRRGFGGVLADEMGLGKTLQAIALFCHAVENGATAPFLVVAPTSVVWNWAAEIERFAPSLKVATVAETQRKRGDDLAKVVAGAQVVVTSYALFRLEAEEYAELPWAALVLDEAQFVKNRTSLGYRAARQLDVPSVFALTGTPLENNLLELWSMLSLTAPGLFPDPHGFDHHFRAPIEQGGSAERMDELRRRIRPFLLRRSKKGVLAELPPRLEQVIEVPLSADHHRGYQTYLQRERQKILGLLGKNERRRFRILRSLTLLRQAALDLALVDDVHEAVGSAKLDALVELVGEIAGEGSRVLVFSQFTRFLGSARLRLEEAGLATAYLDGVTADREAAVRGFTEGDAPAFLISLKAGGFGLNLTEADYVILLDPWWNPATEAQAVARAHRIGQRRPVVVYRLVAKGTIEEKVMALKARKTRLFDEVLETGEAVPAGLSDDDIRMIIEGDV